jgi:GTP cyclohydrolase II
MELNMAMVPPPTRDKDSKNLLDHKIVSVERAASDLRRGLAVVISEGHDSILVQSAELLTDPWIERLRDLSGSDPVVGLTYNRANVLRVLPRSGDVALISLSGHMDSAVIQSMANPADD